jgi:D-alanyl-D-alanine carboxypeptidase
MIKILISFIVSFFTFIPNNKEHLAEKINNILRKSPLNSKSSIIIYNPLDQDTLYKKNIFDMIIPASITKLYTTATALQLLGKDYKIKTQLLTDDDNLKDGIVNGNIYIKGFGNPAFTSYDLESFAEKLLQLGIKEITGNILGDDSYFDKIYKREDWIDDETSNVPLAPISALVLDRNKKSIPKKLKRRTVYSYINISNPPLEIAQKFYNIISNKGILIHGEAKEGITTNKTLTLEESYISLKDLISYINKYSDNFYAECLFKIIGAEFSRSQGTYFYSQQAIKEFLKKNDIPSFTTEIVDGSGISRFNKITASSVNALLERMYFDLINFDTFFNSLSIAGVDGTLRNRMNSFIEFRGKTGTLNGVIGIAGYLRTESEDDLIITIIFEYTKGSYNFYRNLQDEIIKEVKEWYKSYSALKAKYEYQNY